jgi:hypothetical protein
LKSVCDDGIVVHSIQEKTMPVRALEDVGRRLKRASAILARLSDSDRRLEIIEEEHLRRDIARHSALREKHPDLWGELEQARKSRNRETGALNRRLRAEGLRPVKLEPSLEQRVKKLQQLDARESARTATPRKRS